MNLSVTIHDGPRQAVVLLHGLTNSHERYEQDVVGWLTARGHRVVNVDLRGHGASPHAASYDLEDYAGDVSDLLASTVNGNPIVIGHSMGGVIALDAARDPRNSIAAVFLEDPALFRPRRGDRLEVIETARLQAEDLRRGREAGLSVRDVVTVLSASPSVYAGTSMGEVVPSEYLTAAARALVAVDPRTIDEFFAWKVFEQHDHWVGVECPVTVVASDPSLDAHFLPTDVDILRTSIPHADVVVAEGAGHSILLHPDGPGFYLGALGRFLDTHAGR